MMETRDARTFILAVLMIVCTIGTIQAKKKYTQTEYDNAKGFALCIAMYDLNKHADSTSVILHDYTGSYFVQMTRLSLAQMDKITQYVNTHIGDYVATPQEEGGNMIAFACWKFYESKELERYLRKILSVDEEISDRKMSGKRQ